MSGVTGIDFIVGFIHHLVQLHRQSLLYSRYQDIQPTEPAHRLGDHVDIIERVSLGVPRRVFDHRRRRIEIGEIVIDWLIPGIYASGVGRRLGTLVTAIRRL